MAAAVGRPGELSFCTRDFHDCHYKNIKICKNSNDSHPGPIFSNERAIYVYISSANYSKMILPYLVITYTFVGWEYVLINLYAKSM